MSKSFKFKRTLRVEETYEVQMSDEMANKIVARSLLLRQLSNGKFTEAVKLIESKVVSTGRVS